MLELVKELSCQNTVLSVFLKNKRIEKKLNLAELAEATGIEDISLIISYECGDRSIPLSHLYSIANVLNIKPSELLDLLAELGY